MHTEKIRDPEESQAVASARHWESAAKIWIDSSRRLLIERDDAREELEKQKSLTAMWEKVADKWRILSFVSMIVLGVGFIAIGLLSASIGSWW